MRRPRNTQMQCLLHYLAGGIKNKKLKPAAHLRKELNKLPREAISSAVSSSVLRVFVRISRGEISNIKHGRYFTHGLARRKTHENATAHMMKQLS